MSVDPPVPDWNPPMAPALAPPPPLARFPTGVPGLDAVLHGGFFQGSLYLLTGAPGTGKTILANQLAFHQVAGGGRAVYVTLLVETHGRLLAHLRGLDFFAPAAVAQTLHYFSGAGVLQEQGLDALLALVTGLVREQQATLLVLEGLDTAEALAPSELALKAFLLALQIGMEMRGCTTLLVAQAPAGAAGPLRAAADGILELGDARVGLRRVRELEVRKLRGSGYLRNPHAFTITDAGITVYPRTEALVPPAPRAPAAPAGAWASAWPAWTR